jgi:hypothetical protein
MMSRLEFILLKMTLARVHFFSDQNITVNYCKITCFLRFFMLTFVFKYLGDSSNDKDDFT